MVGFRKHSNLGNRCAKSVHNNQIISHADTGECPMSPKYSEVGMIISISLPQISLNGGALCLQRHVPKEFLQLQKGQHL